MKIVNPLILTSDRIRAKENDSTFTLITKTGAEFEVPVHMAIGIASSKEFEPIKVLSEADARMYDDKEKWYETNTKYQSKRELKAA